MSVGNADQTQSPAEDKVMPTPVPIGDQDKSPSVDIPSASGSNKTEPSRDKGKKLMKKRKRLESNLARNVRNKASKSPNELSEPRGASSPSNRETQPAAPVRRRGTTRLTAVKHQLTEALEENSRLKNVIRLLETDIDKKNKDLNIIFKCDAAQKSDIKKLTQHIDELKKELLLCTKKTSQASSREADRRPETDNVMRELQGLRDHVDKSVSALIVSLNSGESDNEGFQTFSKGRRRRPNTTRSSPARDTPSAVTPCDPAPLRPRVPPSNMPSRPISDSGSGQTVTSGQGETGPRVAVIGSSLVRGMGHKLNRRGMDAMTFTFPSCEVPLIAERVSGILTRDYQPETVILQCGGNDLANNRPTAQVVKQIDLLVREVRRCCPRANIVINKIPPRGRDESLLQNIEMVNTYISNMASENNHKVYCCDPCPKMFKHFAKDEVHFNHSGKHFFAYELCKFLTNFHWPLPQHTR